MKALIEKTEKIIFTIAVSRNSTSPALLKEFQQIWQVPCFSQHITGHQKGIRFATELHIQDNHNSKLEYQEVKRLLKQATITIWYKHSGGTQPRTLKIQSTTTQKPKNKTKLQCDACFLHLVKKIGCLKRKVYMSIRVQMLWRSTTEDTQNSIQDCPKIQKTKQK